MSNPILTIGIPTYKRPEQIQQTVRILLPQLTDEIALVVYDNCSPVPVSSLFTDEEKKHFTIKQNKANIGGDANIAGVLYNCDTKWCWTLGDDDYIREDAVEVVLAHIKKYPDFAFFKFNSPYAQETHGFMDVAKLCKRRKIFSVYSRLTFMSTSIYNMEKMHDYLFYYYRYLSTKNGQNIFLLKYLEANDDAVCLFTETSIVDLKPSSVIPAWSYEDLIVSCPLLFYAFKEKRKQMNGTLFVGITFGYFHGIFFSNLSFFKGLKWFFYVVRNYGVVNTIRYHGILLTMYILSLFVPKKLVEKVKAYRRNKKG
ncbi:MAG: glycosyltransferase [Bacteroidaceae bacterium]|nr:glycosyltransferase [Bacteroidaceae bacterium]